MSSGTTRVLLGAGILAGAGCSALLGVDPDRYVATGDDAGERSPEAGPKEDAAIEADAAAAGAWGCLSGPPEVLDPALQVDVTLTVLDPTWASVFVSNDGGPVLEPAVGDWLPNVAVRPCALLDPDCLNAPNAVLTDDAGRAQFSLTGDFTGFFDVRRSDLVPASLYPGHLLAGQRVASLFNYDFTRTQLLNLAASAGATVSLDADAGVGHALVWIYDCQDHQAPGVSITYDNLGSQGQTFYFSNGLPDLTAKETDDFGLAGAVNLPVGTVKATATLVSGGTELGSASFDIRSGSLTSAWIRVRAR